MTPEAFRAWRQRNCRSIRAAAKILDTNEHRLRSFEQGASVYTGRAHYIPGYIRRACAYIEMYGLEQNPGPEILERHGGLKAWRQSVCSSQREFAKIFGVGQNSWEYIERGQTTPTRRVRRSMELAIAWIQLYGLIDPYPSEWGPRSEPAQTGPVETVASLKKDIFDSKNATTD